MYRCWKTGIQLGTLCSSWGKRNGLAKMTWVSHTLRLLLIPLVLTHNYQISLILLQLVIPTRHGRRSRFVNTCTSLTMLAFRDKPWRKLKRIEMPMFFGKSICKTVDVKILGSKCHHTHFRFPKYIDTFDFTQAAEEWRHNSSKSGYRKNKFSGLFFEQAENHSRSFNPPPPPPTKKHFSQAWYEVNN